MSAQPNILWVSLESVRADHTSLYGYQRDTTPYLRELGDRADATVLDPVISASMWTPASTASMLTGTHMSTHQVGRDGKGQKKLPQSMDTLPGLLAGNGYRTLLFSTTPYIGPDTGLDQGFDHAEVIGVKKENFLGVDSVSRDTYRCALRCLRENPTLDPKSLERDLKGSKNYLLERRFERAFAGGGTEPFFGYAHVPSPHHEYAPVARFRDEYTADIEMGPVEAADFSRRAYAGTEAIKRRMATGLDFTDREWAAIRAMYDAEIKSADATVARLVSLARDASDRPLVIVVTGDHGDLFGTYGLIGHNLVLHDGLIRVPGVVVGIDGVEDGPETVTQHIDLTRTVAAAGGASSGQFEGRDVRDAGRRYAISQRGIAHFDNYTEHDETFDTTRFFEEPFTCVRTTKWKYLENESRRVLYDLPDEQSNVLESHPDVAAELSAILRDTEGIDWTARTDTESATFDEESRERLRDLGYIT